MNSFGDIFKITTFGESHGQYIGVVIDGVLPNIEIFESEIDEELKKRRPGNNFFTSIRNELDKCEIVSGVYENKTTGAPICILIKNRDIDSTYYEKNKNLLKPSHANFTYLNKYKIFDHRGSSRASARETTARVAAGVIAKKILKNLCVTTYLNSVGDIFVDFDQENLDFLDKSQIFCPNREKEIEILKLLKKTRDENDTIGSSVGFYVNNMFENIGEPIFDKFHAKLSYALMSIPGAKAFEIGDGFSSSLKKGSLRNDLFYLENNIIKTRSNNEGGVLGGITNGMPVYGRVYFKPPSTIYLAQKTLDFNLKEEILINEKNDRSDICIAIRACPVVKAMLYITICDLYLKNRIYNEENSKKN